MPATYQFSPLPGLVLKALEGEAKTAKELSAELKVGESTLRGALKHLKDQRLIKIADWPRKKSGRGRVPVPAYKAGRGADQPKPKPMTPEQRQAGKNRARDERRRNPALRAQLALAALAGR